jgi:hypothetical protein
MAHWSDYNPWACSIVYAPDLESWLNCLANYSQKTFYREEAERLSKVDCYILPAPSGQHSMGMRYGKDGGDYYSPLCNAHAAQRLITKFQGG